MQQRFLLQILLLAQHVSGTTMPITRSSGVLYNGCCLWYFVLWYFSSCWSGVELRVMCPVCRMLQHPANRTQKDVVKYDACKLLVVSRKTYSIKLVKIVWVVQKTKCVVMLQTRLENNKSDLRKILDFSVKSPWRSLRERRIRFQYRRLSFPLRPYTIPVMENMNNLKKCKNRRSL